MLKPLEMHELKPWAIIKLGVLFSAAEAVPVLQNMGVRTSRSGTHGSTIDSWPDEILEQIKFDRTSRTVELIKVNTFELGVGNKSVPESQVLAAANKLGLQLAPAEVGPQIWLQAYDQIMLEGSVRIAMEPMLPELNHGFSFHPVRDTGYGKTLWCGKRYHPDPNAGAVANWVFIREIA